MKRLSFPLVLVGLASVAAFVLAGCGQEGSSAEREERREPAAERGQEQGSSPKIEPRHVGEVVEVGPLLVKLNDAKPYTSGDQGEGGARQSHYYVVVDLTLENGAQTSFDASDVDYLLRDEEGYSFKRKSIPDQKPPPEGQVMPGGKASGQVAFDLGTEPVGAPLTLFVSVPDVEGASQGIFEFEVRHETQKKAKPGQNSQDSEEAASESALYYRTFTDDTGALRVEIPSGWEVVNDEDVAVKALNSQGAVVAREGTGTAISAAPSIDSWEGTEGVGTSIIAVKDLAQRFTDDQLIDAVPALNSFSLNCATGEREDLDRPGYSGRVQAWSGCDLGVPTYYTMSASPEGRGCAVIAQIGAADEANKDAARRILDTFEVGCGLVTSEPLPSPSTPATSSASASSSASATPEVSPSSDNSEDLDCRDFVSGAEAQAALEDDPNDPHNLDADSDGLACEDSSFAEPSTTDPSAPPSSPPSPSSDSREPSPGSGSGRDLDCDDFSSQEEAQEVLEDDPSDPHGLDADDDGEACED